MSDLIKSEDYEIVELETEHIFSDGLYTRKLHIPKGVILEGKRHRHKTLNILAKGKMEIFDGRVKHIAEAGFVAESDEFTKKYGVALEDSIWINVHQTKETDLEKIEKEFIISDEEFNLLIGREGNKCLG